LCSPLAVYVWYCKLLVFVILGEYLAYRTFEFTGECFVHAVFHEGFKRKTGKSDSFYDIIPNTITCKYPSLIARLKDKTCELCGAEGDTTMFQVRNLNALKGKNEWEQKMLKLHRKTLAVCSTCNKKIHNER
ncbi:hypothetical protein EZS27_034418, partial [termite gut metagenome]